MRNHWYDKVLNFIISIVLLFAALVFIAMPLSAARSFIGSVMVNLNGFGAVVFVALGIFLLVLFAYTFAGLFSAKKKIVLPTSVNVKVSEIGSVDITLSALDTLILKAARALSSVKDCKAQITPADGAVSITLIVSLMPEANIPELTEKLQSEVKAFVESRSGVSVKEIKVIVESAGVNPAARVQ